MPGEVRLFGRPVTGASPDRVFKLGIGRTFQLTRIFARLTVLENMLVATQRGEGWLRSVVRAAGSASERGRALELLDFVGIRRLAGEPAGNLSYGQRKLLELASLLVADPAVLLLDEPAGGVNPTLINQLAARIRDLNADGKTFLVVEHNMEFVMSLCDEVTVLSQGRTLDLRDARRGPCRPGRARRLPGRRRGQGRSPRPTCASSRAPPEPGVDAGAAAEHPRCRRGLRRRRHPQGRLLRRARGRDHLHRRPQRRREVDAARHDQRPAAPAQRRDPACAARRSPASPPARSSRAASRSCRRRTRCSRR